MFLFLKKSMIPAVALCVTAVLFLSSCGKNTSDFEKHKKQLYAMDTIIEMTAYGESANVALDKAATKLTALENKLSATRNDSAIFEINSSAGTTVDVTTDVLVPLHAALDISAKSGGALDISIYPVVKAWGFISKSYRVPDIEELSILLKSVDFKNISVIDNSVSVPQGTEIDLGSVAKGYASQCVCDLLKENGVTSAIVSLGGNVQTVGKKPDGKKWRVAICDPQDPNNGTIGILNVSETAVVTSGGYQRFFQQNGKTYHHIINPSNGYPAESGLLSVTVVCSDGTYADGLSTALFVLGLDKAMDYYNDYGDFEAVFVSTDGSVTVTDGLNGCFEAS